MIKSLKQIACFLDLTLFPCSSLVMLLHLLLSRTIRLLLLCFLDADVCRPTDAPWLSRRTISCLRAHEIDRGIVQVLREVGDGGILPSHLSGRLNMANVDRWRVTRRVQRMNKRLGKELGQALAEKRGHRWAMTGFAYGILLFTQEELEGHDGSAEVAAAVGRHPPMWRRERRKRNKPS